MPRTASPKRKPALSAIALQSLREAIASGRLAPGERLVEERLSADLGMSRVPIREAIKQLMVEGLAEPAEAGAGRGARVTALTEELARDLIEVRAVLEGLTARLAARRRDAKGLELILAMLRQGDALAAADSNIELAALNASFHDLLAAAGANQALQELMRPLRERTELVFRRNSVGRASDDWREHAMILSAVAEGDEELAALLAARHVRRAGRARAEVARQEPVE
ncbi:GntR family transcriptional regulator [Roseococcus sp. YIM B11640]|uniref:GntR family transcriptional regulator n=1 Tax=Roseococcus sp. YIM B11640 TaxID=3133973 RepID=UPI003C79BCB8